MENEKTTPSLEQREALRKLVAKFEGDIQRVKKQDYTEDDVRAEYIDQFFSLLGWDMHNKSGAGEVKRQDSVQISGRTKKPDYGFYIGNSLKFFLEAKKPVIDIRGDAGPAEQVRLYGWNKKLPISILTDFEEFSVYNTRVKPKSSAVKKEPASVARDFYCTFREYEEKFDEIYALCSREAVLGGSLDIYAGKTKGTLEVDDDLLQQIEEWRELLAKNIHKQNEGLSVFDLNTVVQKMIDRLIFLRFAEDRGIEKENLLREAGRASEVYAELKKIFAQAITKYNAGLFAKDKFIDNVCIDGDVLTKIIEDLYYPNSPYLFDVLPVEILGSIYERFLGKTIRLTEKRVKVEAKPEVKKAGGVYYTPQYIVDYIVQNTVGEKIKGKTPEEITQIKICDPACGSGSFLIGAYQYLLDYHLEYYTQAKNIKSAIKGEKIYKASSGAYKLTIAEKQRVLTSSIFGVDIDQQAVEVSKLSLYLKLLEGETMEAQEQNRFTHSSMALLPSLEENIKCGNSLIGTDFYAQLELNTDERLEINCFDWVIEFPAVFQTGGFDVVLGNPPYYNVETLGANSEIVKYIQKKYSKIWQDKSDILFYFLAQSMFLSKGNMGFILSNALLYSNKAQKLRNALIEDGRLWKIINFEQFLVFKGAAITSGLFIFNKKHDDTKFCVLKEKVYTIDDVIKYINDDKNYFNISLYSDNVFALVDKKVEDVNTIIDGKHQVLQDICLIGSGMQTAANDVFVFNTYPKQFPKNFIKKRIVGENISRYHLANAPDFMLYFEDIENFRDLPVSIQDHLKAHKQILANRADKKRRPTAPWWNYTFAMHREYYHLPKIWCSYRGKGNAFVLDETSDYIGLTNTTVIFGTSPAFSLKYILALLNSKLLSFRYKSIGKQTGSGIFEYFANGIGKLPIPDADEKTQNSFASLVDKMLDLKQKEAAESNPKARESITRQIKSIDNEIDAAVYALYGLTADEIKIVEER